MLLLFTKNTRKVFCSCMKCIFKGYSGEESPYVDDALQKNPKRHDNINLCQYNIKI